MIEDFEREKMRGPYLTEIEAKLVKMLAAGLTNGEIAKIRGRSLQTIKNQLSLIYRKFGVGHARELLVKLGANDKQNPKLFRD